MGELKLIMIPSSRHTLRGARRDQEREGSRTEREELSQNLRLLVDFRVGFSALGSNPLGGRISDVYAG